MVKSKYGIKLSCHAKAGQKDILLKLKSNCGHDFEYGFEYIVLTLKQAKKLVLEIEAATTKVEIGLKK